MNTAELLDQLSTAVHRDAARRRRKQRVAVALTSLVLFAVGGVAVAGTTDGWWGEVANENASVGIDLDLSTKTTVATTDDAMLEAVQTNGGKGYCLSLTVAAKHMGTSCTTVADSEYRTRADADHWVAYGRILDANAASLDLSGAGLPANVPLERGGFFLLDIPRARWASLDQRVGGISVLDADGRTIRTACIAVGVAPPSSWAGGGSLGDTMAQCESEKPIVPNPELDQAKKLVSLTLQAPHGTFVAGQTISLWEMPNRGGGVCWVLGPALTGHYLSSCGHEQRLFDHELPVDAMGGLVSGWAPVDSGIVRVTVDGVDATLANGAFIAEAGGGPVVVVGYDAAGKEVASTRLPGR